MVTNTVRRNVLKAIGAGVIGAGFSGTASADSPLSPELNAVRETTRQYRDIEVARDDDYVPITGYVPEMGFHFSDRTPPFGEDPQDPPVLVYFTNDSYNPSPGDEHDPDRDEDLILGAVEYIIRGDQTDDPPNIFNDEDSNRNLKLSEEEGWQYNDHGEFTALHAWVHRGNPAGVFHPTNPTID